MILIITMSGVLDLGWLPVTSDMVFNLYKTVFKALNGEDWPLYLQVEVRALKQNMNLILLFQNTQAPSKTVPCDVSTLTSSRPSQLCHPLPRNTEEIFANAPGPQWVSHYYHYLRFYCQLTIQFNFIHTFIKYLHYTE